MKKKLIVLALVLLVASVTYAAVVRVVPLNKTSNQVNPGELHTGRNAWVVLDTTSSAGDEPNDLAVDERTYLTVLSAISTGTGGDDEISTFLLHSGTRQGWNRVKFRCRGITDGGTATYQIYIGTLGRAPVTDTTDCELAKVGQLAFTVGTQVSTLATYEMADTLTVTEGFSSVRSWLSSSPTSEHVAEAELDVSGADVIVAVPTVASADCQLLVTGF